MKLFNPMFKKLLFFLGEPIRIFNRCSFRCFHLIIDFYNCFRMFPLLIVFGHFITVSSCVFLSPLILLLFFECFQFTNFLYRDCFFVRYFIFVLLHRECYEFERAIFTLRRFIAYTPSRNLAQRAFIKASLGPAVLL